MLPYQNYFKKMTMLWHYGLFYIMALVSVYVILFFLFNHTNIGFNNIGLLLIAGAAAAAWYNSTWALFGFVAAIPLINGFRITMSPLPGNIYNFIFSGIYIVWFVKYCLLQKKDVRPISPAGLLMDMLSTAIIFSLLAQLLNYPAEEVFLNIWSASSFDQSNSFYSIHAAYIILQGLFLYRMLELTVTQQDMNQPFIIALGVLTTMILLFSAIQGVFNVPPWAWDRLLQFDRHGLLSPFDDIHSYGSVILLLVPVYLFALQASGSRFVKIMCGSVAGLLILCALLSMSRTAMILVTVIVLLYVLQRVGKTRKMLICFALAVLVSAALYSIVSTFADKTYLNRDSIYQTLGYRLLRMENTWFIIKTRPLSGTGIGSYYRVYTAYGKLDLENTPMAGRLQSVWQHTENAHNYFLQLAADIGLPGMALFIMIIFCLYWAAVKAQRSGGSQKLLRAGLMNGFGAYLVTLIPAHPLLLSNQQFIFWFAAAGMSLPVSQKRAQHSFKAGFFGRVFISLLWVLILWGNGSAFMSYKTSPGYRGYGLYRIDLIGQKYARWTQQKSEIRLMAKTDIIKLQFIVFPYNIDRDGLKVNIKIDDIVVDTRTIFAAGDYQEQYYVPGAAGKSIAINTEVSKTFTPRLLGLNEDNRTLGIALVPFKFITKLQPDGIGLYQWEEWQIDGKPVKVRWTRKQATMAMTPGNAAQGVKLGLLSYHPDVIANPVIVTILGDGSMLKTIKLTDKYWKHFELKTEDIGRVTYLTFRVSRTWNPKAAGVSNDQRDLGVAVAIE